MPKAAVTILVACSLFVALAGGLSARAAESLPPTPATGSDYHLGAGDKLRLTVFGEDNLSGQYVVSTTGKLAIPLIGEINAQGASTAEVERMIDAKLRDGYLRDPRVSLEVMTYRPFYILGEVSRPGEYPYTADLTVVKAVATANGYTYRANTKRVYIKHVGEAVEKPYPAGSTTMVAPGDTIRVTERLF